MNGITVPARNAGSRKRAAERLCCLPRCSVDGLTNLPGICVPGFAQPIIVVLQTFYEGLQIANSRSESCALEDQPIVPIHPLTQQRLGHTNSVEILRACEGRLDTDCGRLQSGQPTWGHSQRLTGFPAGQRYGLVTFRKILIVPF